MPVAKEKTLGPTDLLEYLSLILNFVSQCLGIPEKKRLKCLGLVQRVITSHKERKRLMVKVIQQTAGSLYFICQALPAGCLFLVSLYRLMRCDNGERRVMDYHRQISKETCKDMHIFEVFFQRALRTRLKQYLFLLGWRLSVTVSSCTLMWPEVQKLGWAAHLA